MCKTENDIQAKYTFTVEGGGAKSTEKPKMKVLKRGIRLYFMRKGLFYDNTKEARNKITAWQINDEALSTIGTSRSNTDDEFTLSDCIVEDNEIPKSDNYSIYNTKINTGYIYLINADNPSDHHEFLIDESGLLTNIMWKGSNLDVRLPSINEKAKLYYYVGKTPKKFYIAYSPVQWSASYHKSIRNSEDKQKELMKLVNCKGVPKGEEGAVTDIYPYFNTRGTFYRTNKPDIQLYRSTYLNIHNSEKKDEKEGGNEVFEDMFISLDDPIGIAEDIAVQLIIEHNKHKALIESIQFGENENDIFSRLEKNKSRSELFSDYEQQVSGLFSTALTTYQLIYNNGKMEEDYADTTDKNKLLKILAVKERKATRNKTIKVRNDFGTFLSSDYYQNYLPTYTEGCNQNIFQGNYTVLAHLDILAIHPHDRDRHLDLKKDYTGRKDKWKNFYLSTLNGNNNITNLLNKEIKLEGLKETSLDIRTQFKLERKLIKTLKSITGAYAKYAVREADFQVVLKYIKSFKYEGETVIQVKRSQLENAVKKGYVLNISKWVEEQKLANYKRGHKLIRIKTGIDDSLTKEIVANKRIGVSVTGTGNKTSHWITKVLAHPKFRAFMAGLELINTAVKVNKLNTTVSGKNIIKTAGAVSSLVSASTSYAEAKIAVKGIKLSTTANTLITNTAKITGFIGSGVTVTMCVWDSIETYQARDYDASLTWAITGALSAVLLADSIMAFAAGATVGFLTFWPLAILFVLVLVGVALAIYFTDTPLEKFLKNNVLGSEHPLAASNEAPYIYIKKIYDKRTTLVESDFKEWRDFKKASQLLYDLLISYRVKEEMQFYYENKPNKSWGDYMRDAVQLSAGVKYKKAKEVTLKVRLRKFLYNKSSFDFAMKLFIKGVKEASDSSIILLAQKTSITTDSNGVDILNVTYNLPQITIDKITLASEFVFISRTIINEQLNEYWPHKNEEEERYMAYKFSATDWLAPTGDILIANKVNEILDEVWGTNIKIGTENEVYNPKTWER